MRNSGAALSKFNPKGQEQIIALLHPKAATVAPAPARSTSQKHPFTIWLRYHVPSLNTLLGSSRFAIKRRKTEALEALDVTLANCPPLPLYPGGRMHVIITCYVCQPRDTDNPVPKFIIDALRYRGILRADDPGAMLHTMNPEVKVGRRKLQGTKITICEALP